MVIAGQKKDAAVNDDQLVKSYQQKLESKETESASGTSTDDDDSDDDTTTENDLPPAPRLKNYVQYYVCKDTVISVWVHAYQADMYCKSVWVCGYAGLLNSHH